MSTRHRLCWHTHDGVCLEGVCVVCVCLCVFVFACGFVGPLGPGRFIQGMSLRWCHLQTCCALRLCTWTGDGRLARVTRCRPAGRCAERGASQRVVYVRNARSTFSREFVVTGHDACRSYDPYKFPSDPKIKKVCPCPCVCCPRVVRVTTNRVAVRGAISDALR